MQECRWYAYRLPAGPFRPHEVGGYWVADEPVDAVEQVVIDDLAGRHAENARLLRLLKMTPEQAAPPGPRQAAFFEAPPGSVHDESPPEVKVAFFGTLFADLDDVDCRRVGLCLNGTVFLTAR